jgi:3-hydroxy-9,10-secoandrosta-1,3,5(10)-triene-9,17-dione monooxygenase reductase component
VSDPYEPPSEATFDGARFRQVLGHFPTGVTVITAMDDETPVGLAVGSFSSVSLDPPLVLFCAAQSSSSWPRIREAGRFCVNILGEDQESICRQFASSGADKFAGVGWKHTAGGAPLLDGVLAWLDCEIVEVLGEGDHDVAIGRVTDLAVGHEGRPLVFYRGGYGSFAS